MPSLPFYGVAHVGSSFSHFRHSLLRSSSSSTQKKNLNNILETTFCEMIKKSCSLHGRERLVALYTHNMKDENSFRGGGNNRRPFLRAGGHLYLAHHLRLLG